MTNANLMEINRLNNALVRETRNHEQAMRCLISMLSTRGDIIRNAKTAQANWMEIAIAANRKVLILESRIRNDNRSFMRMQFEKED